MTVCEDELVCDLAEVYGVFSYRSMDPKLIATLCMGLRDDSRIKMKISNSRVTLSQALWARIADELTFLSWTKTKDAQKGRNRPASILKMLTEEKEVEAFADADAFLEAWASIVGESDNA